MFDYHLHTRVSFDGKDTPGNMVRAAVKAGLREICFTDHLDYCQSIPVEKLTFDTRVYNEAYDRLDVPGMKIRKGIEFGMTPDNREMLKRDLQRRHFDFVLGSVHFVAGEDAYYAPYWRDKTPEQAMERYLLEILRCVEHHDDFDVLGHLTYISKSRDNPDRTPIGPDDFRDITDEILRILVRKGKGMELNTSGMDRCGDYLPGEGFFRRFRQLGGQIVTVGSDAHAADRMGQYTGRACEMLKDIFGYVCTFEDRKPIFHKL